MREAEREAPSVLGELLVDGSSWRRWNHDPGRFTRVANRMRTRNDRKLAYAPTPHTHAMTKSSAVKSHVPCRRDTLALRIRAPTPETRTFGHRRAGDGRETAGRS